MFDRPTVCLVTSRRRVAPDARTTADELTSLIDWLEAAIAAGVDLIQIRELDLEAATLRDLTRAVVARAAGTSTRVLVNDRADVAVAAGAHGVHLRADGPPVADIRRLGGAAWLVGRSIHAAGEAAIEMAPDYFLFGHVFRTISKPGVTPSGLTALTGAVRAARVPVLAIGGITPDRAAACARAGARGVAAIGVFLPPGRSAEALGPAAAVAALRAALEPPVLE